MDFDTNAKHFVKKAYFITDRRFMTTTESAAYCGLSYGTFRHRKEECSVCHTYRVNSTLIYDRRDLEALFVNEMFRQITKNGKKAVRYFQEENVDEYLSSQRYLLRIRYKYLEADYFRYLWLLTQRKLQEKEWSLQRFAFTN